MRTVKEAKPGLLPTDGIQMPTILEFEGERAADRPTLKSASEGSEEGGMCFWRR